MPLTCLRHQPNRGSRQYTCSKRVLRSLERKTALRTGSCGAHAARAPEQGPTPVQRLASVFAAVVVTAATHAGAAHAGESLIGAPRVVDGDTLELAGTKIRLYGIDAPETKQLCKDGAGKDYECGVRSAAALSQKIGRDQVLCSERNKDMYGRTVAVCFLNGREDLNAWMVTNGQAVAYKEYSADYVATAERAKGAKLGIWQGDFQYPADWRRAHKADGKAGAAAVAVVAGGARNDAAPGGSCLVKGNINAQGEKIYHVQGGRAYASTTIDLAAGERWFCSEEDAVKAGWRPSKV